MFATVEREQHEAELLHANAKKAEEHINSKRAKCVAMRRPPYVDSARSTRVYDPLRHSLSSSRYEDKLAQLNVEMQETQQSTSEDYNKEQLAKIQTDFRAKKQEMIALKSAAKEAQQSAQKARRARDDAAAEAKRLHADIQKRRHALSRSEDSSASARRTVEIARMESEYNELKVKMQEAQGTLDRCDVRQCPLTRARLAPRLRKRHHVVPGPNQIGRGRIHSRQGRAESGRRIRCGLEETPWHPHADQRQV